MGLRNHDPYFWNQKIDPISDIRNKKETIAYVKNISS